MSAARCDFWLFFAFICLAGRTNGTASVSTVFNVAKRAMDATKDMDKAWHSIDQAMKLTQKSISVSHPTEAELFKKFEGIVSKFDGIADVHYDNMVLVLNATVEEQPGRVRLEIWLNNLLDYVGRIDANYQRMQEYSKQPNEYDKQTIEDFIDKVISHDPNSAINLLQRIHAYVVPERTGISRTDLFEELAKAMQEVEGGMMCSIKQSPQQVLYSLYKVIALTELKGYTMIQFCYMIRTLDQKGNFTKEVQNSRKNFEERTNSAVTTIGSLLRSVSRDMWRCDAKDQVEGETYEQITNLLQGYIQNKAGLSQDHKCRDDCSAYSYNTYFTCEEKYCKHQRRCNGKLLRCQKLDSDFTVCMANLDTNRRYQYVQYDNGKVLGHKGTGCALETARADSWRYWIFWKCSYCLCLCDEEGPMSDRYFNMRIVRSDIRNNKVVTGLRFVKINRVIHLQIQEGAMLPGLKIDSSTVSWKPVESYEITDRKIYEGQDYHKLTWQNRHMDLDDLEADDGYVLTGVRFKEIGTHLNFEIYTTRFDFETGKLKLDKKDSKWNDNPNTSGLRRKLILDNRDIPTRSTVPSIPTSRLNEYFEFSHSDVDKDLAQTTVPFLDTQRVESLEPVPLAGAGIFHKGRPNFGGFVAPKVITYDVSKHMKAVFNSEEVN